MMEKNGFCQADGSFLDSKLVSPAHFFGLVLQADVPEAGAALEFDPGGHAVVETFGIGLLDLVVGVLRIDEVEQRGLAPMVGITLAF